jgi:3-oxoacyl-[acyl-carrier-protein] synthase-1
LIEIAVPAATEAWKQSVPAGSVSGTVGLYLGLDYGDENEQLVAALSATLGIRAHAVGGASAGRAAGLLALDAAAQALLAGTVQLALVGAVDSQIRSEVLQRLESKEILRSGANPQGVIPGEAAAFLVLEGANGAARRGARPQAWLMSVASSKEPTVGTDEPNRAAGLTDVLSTARREGGFEKPPLAICDLNGDRYRAMEWGMSSIRALGNLHGDMDVWHPADCIGDTGAASGLLNVGWGVTALLKDYARAQRILVWGASDGRSRAAAVLAPYTA